MPDQLQQPMSPPLPPASIGAKKSDTREVIGEEQIDPIAEELARQELARISLSNEELMKLAAKCGPLPKWLDEDEPLVDEAEEERAMQELARISLSNAELLELAKKNPPPPEYFEGEEEMPFDPIEK